MRVLLISHAFPPDMGATSARALSIANSLEARHHEVEILAGRPYYPMGVVPKRYWHRFATRESKGKIKTVRTWVPAVPTIGLSRRLEAYVGFELSYAFALLVFFLAERYDFIYYISPYALSFFSLPACLFGKIRKVRVLLDVHDEWPAVVTEVGNIRSKTADRILDIMTKVSIRLAYRVMLASTSMGESLHAPMGKLEEAPLVVDTQLFRPPAASKASKDLFVVGYSGILARRYDFDLLIAAAKLVSTDGTTRIRFAIRGQGEMEESIRGSLGGNVALSTELLSSTEVVEWLGATDVLVCPLIKSFEAEHSSVPGKLLEYLAMGKPVVCTDLGEVGRLVRETQAGLLVPPGDARALADAIIYLYEHRDAGDAFGRNGREAAEDRFSLTVLAEKLEHLSGGLR